MIGAFEIVFRAVAVGEPAEVQAHLKTLREACVAHGFDPGSGLCKQLSPEDLSRMPAVQSLIDRRERMHAATRHGEPAEPYLVASLFATLRVEFGGDEARASRMIEALKCSAGYVTADVAELLRSAYAQLPGEVPA